MKYKQLNAQAVQARINKLASEKHPESCANCGSTRFIMSYELRIIPRLEIGSPQDILCQHATIHTCLVCTQPWKREEKDDSNRDGEEGPKRGTGSPDDNGGSSIIGS